MIEYKKYLVNKKEELLLAINILEKTKVRGPTSGAETFIKRKDDPHAMPIAIINAQSITALLFIYIINLSY